MHRLAFIAILRFKNSPRWLNGTTSYRRRACDTSSGLSHGREPGELKLSEINPGVQLLPNQAFKDLSIVQSPFCCRDYVAKALGYTLSRRFFHRYQVLFSRVLRTPSSTFIIRELKILAPADILYSANK